MTQDRTERFSDENRWRHIAETCQCTKDREAKKVTYKAEESEWLWIFQQPWKWEDNAVMPSKFWRRSSLVVQWVKESGVVTAVALVRARVQEPPRAEDTTKKKFLEENDLQLRSLHPSRWPMESKDVSISAMCLSCIPQVPCIRKLKRTREQNPGIIRVGYNRIQTRREVKGLRWGPCTRLEQAKKPCEKLL